MIHLVLQLIVSLLSTFCTFIINSTLNSKNLGAQTLYDLIIMNMLLKYQFFVWNYTFLCIMYYISDNWPIILAQIGFFALIINGINIAMFSMYVPVVKYLLIFHSSIFETCDDKTVLSFSSKVSFIVSLLLATMTSFTDIQPLTSYDWIYLLSGREKPENLELNKASIGVALIFSLAVICHILVQIKLEVENFRFFEGRFFKMVTWLRSKNKILPISMSIYSIESSENSNINGGEVSENFLPEDFSLIFQRISLLLFGLMFVYFIGFQSQKDKEDMLTIPNDQLIQITFADLYMISVILENKKMCKRFANVCYFR